MALHSLYCADVPLRNCSLTHLEQAGVNRSLLANVKSRKLRYFGHIVRGEDKSLEKGIFEVTLPSISKRGRPRTVWIDNVTSWTYGTEA